MQEEMVDNKYVGVTAIRENKRSTFMTGRTNDETYYQKYTRESKLQLEKERTTKTRRRTKLT